MIYRYSRFFVIAFFCTIMTSKAAKLDEEKGNGRGSLQLRMGNGKVAVQIDFFEDMQDSQVKNWEKNLKAREKRNVRLERILSNLHKQGKEDNNIDSLYFANSDQIDVLKKQIREARQK